MLNAIFRINEIEPDSKILIDGIDLKKIGIKLIRSKIAIIPQAPIIFKGTIRVNLKIIKKLHRKIWTPKI